MDSVTVPAQQYYIAAEAPGAVSDERRHVECNGWHLVLDTRFSVVPVFAGDHQIGLVFGTILDPYETITDGAVQLDQAEPAESLATAFEAGMRPLVGRFVGLFASGSATRVYPDPIGSLPVVFDRERSVVAASPLVIPGVSHETHFRDSLYHDIKWPLVTRGANTWIPGTVTYYEGVERVLPNHYLDLQSWESSRFWPRSAVDRTGVDTDLAVETISDHLQTIFEAVDERYSNPKLSLTAGKDSRALLATARTFATEGNLGLFTIGDSDWEVDRHIARRIANSFGLQWISLPVIESSTEERQTWSERTGYTVGSAVKETYRTMWQLDADVELGGLGGEIGRSYLWQVIDHADSEIDPSDILERYNKPTHPVLVESLETWFADVEQFDTYTTLDLAHQEHRLGNWAGPQHLGFRPHVDHIRPYCFRPIIEEAHRLDTDFRRADRLPHRIIDQSWPELELFPYNAFTDWKQYGVKLKNALGMVESAVENPEVAAEYVSRKYS